MMLMYLESFKHGKDIKFYVNFTTICKIKKTFPCHNVTFYQKYILMAEYISWYNYTLTYQTNT